jgi:hypothetical protein
MSRCRKYYWDTAPAGIALGAAGIVSVGVGLWWSLRTRSSSAPLVSLGSSHATIGWTTGF